MAYNIYLFNGLPISAPLNRTDLTPAQFTSIYTTLKGYFDRVVKAHDALPNAKKKYGTSQIIWMAGFMTPAADELLIYLLPYGATVATNGKLEQGKPPAGHDGLTNPNLQGGTGSEVYLHTTDMTVIANLMFHEAMHNKLKLGNQGLHPKGGLASASVSPTTPLTTQNVNDMAAALETTRPQWTAGMQMLVAAANISDNDPMKGLF